MFKGVWKRLLRVDLSKGKVHSEDIKEGLFEKYIGGSGLATKYLYEEVPANIPSLGKENKLIFATGPLQGSSMSGSAKWSVVSLSPLTDMFSVSSAGASWRIRFKKRGWIYFLLKGEYKDPVFLWITDEGVEIQSPENMWRKDAIDTGELVQDRLNEPNESVAAIGPAGKKQVGSACITADEHIFAGRMGLGAVMGSKGLKVIAVKGDESVSVTEPDKLKGLNKDLLSFYTKWQRIL